MNGLRLAAAILAPLLLVSCAGLDDRDTLADLRDDKIDLKDEKIEGGFDKAIQSYQRFLEETPESAMTPEAIRRLADLKVEREYGLDKAGGTRTPAPRPGGSGIDRPTQFDATRAPPAAPDKPDPQGQNESLKDFEKRAAGKQELAPASRSIDGPLPEGGDGLETAGAREAIALYKKLLEKYPNYERNDQVLYNMSRAYEELGEVEQAMAVMNQFIKLYPRSKYIDEVQFRRGEYYFTRRKYLDAEEAYKAITDLGAGSFYYELGLYKLGWAFYKQEMYEDALHKFIALLDHKAATGFDAEQSRDEYEKKRVEDTYRVISLSFSNLGGSDEMVRYFDAHGKRSYEVNIYANLGEFYLEKRRYADAAKAYKAFVTRNPFHKASPHFDMRVIEIYKKGAFARLVIESSRDFAATYGLKSEYWKHFDVNTYPEVLAHLQAILRELAQHYHALYQNKQFQDEKAGNFAEAQRWYRDFLSSFPKDAATPGMHFQLAELLLENKSLAEAAVEYEHTAYDYPAHEKSAAAGYAAVYARREQLKLVADTGKGAVRREVVRSSLKFADTFPAHEKAAIVLGAAVDDLYEMKDYEQSIQVGHKLLAVFPQAEQAIRRGAWLVVAHASFELMRYKEAEAGYVNVLALMANDDKARPALADNLAASIYKQGEQASKAQDLKAAVDHYLRIALVAPASKIRPTAEYDAAAALIQLKDWDRAVEVLQAFRKNFPAHELQPEATKKIALSYRESGKLATAAAEYERIETESKDEEVRRSALLVAADLYEQVKDATRALQVYRRYVGLFPKPVELALESRYKIAGIHKNRNDQSAYTAELKLIVETDARAGSERTDRTRYLGAMSLLALTEPLFEQFTAIKLTKPFKKNLKRLQEAMKSTTDAFGKLTEYKVGEATGAATFYIAEIYYRFGRALLESERPDNLSALELEQYELAIEEQAYPFEEKAIEVHAKNLELLAIGAYSAWVDKSIGKLAKLVPARYARAEESSGFIDSMASFRYDPPAPPPPPVAPAAGTPPAQTGSVVPAGQPEAVEPAAGMSPEQAIPLEKTARPEPTGTSAPAAQPEMAPPDQFQAPAQSAQPETVRPEVTGDQPQKPAQ